VIPKPLFDIRITAAHQDGVSTFTATAQLTAHGKTQLEHMLMKIAPQSMALQTREGTILLLPPTRK